MRNKSFVAALALSFLFSGIAVGDEKSIEADNLVVGKRSGSTNPSLKFRGTTQSIRANTTTDKLEFSNDGSTFKVIGSGAGGDGGVNLLADNADFELGISVNWTNSGGSYAALSGAANALFDLTSFRFNASAADQTVTSDAYDVPVGLQGGPCLGVINYETTETTNKYKLLALDGDDDSVIAEQSLDATNGLVIKGYVPFQCPTSGTVKLQLKSTGDAADIDGDDAHLGSDTRIAEISQASFYGSVLWPATASCSWSVSTSSFGNFAADADCTNPSGSGIKGQASVPATKVPGITFATLPPGEYIVIFSGEMQKSSTSATSCNFRISDGTNSSNAVTMWTNSVVGSVPTFSGHFSYTAAQSNITFQAQASSSGSDACAVVADATQGSIPLEIRVMRYPSATEVGFRADQLGWHVDANISGANPSLGTSDQASYVGIEDGSLTLTNNSGSGVVTAQIPCSSTNSPTGTTCSVGNESVGVSFTAPTAGDVIACATFSHNIVTAASGVVNATFQIVETASNAQTVVQEGKGRTQSGFNTASSTITFPHRVCGTFNFTSSGQKTLRLFYEQDVTATVTTNAILGDASASLGQRDIHWEVYPLNYQSGALAIFKGMVSSNSSSRERLERLSFAAAANEATICSSSPCTVHAQSGSWISSVTRSSAGVYVGNIAAGTFSQTPVCTCTALTTSSQGGLCHIIRSSSSSTSLDIRTFANNLTPADTAVQVICMGQN